MADLEEGLLRSLVVDAPPRLLWCFRLLDVHIETIDRVTALVHWWFP